MNMVIRNLSDQLVDIVRERVLSGDMPIDASIRQEALAMELGISKIPLREALARLEEEGLLRSRTNRGYFVLPLTRHEAEEVYAIRIKLEPDLMVLGAERATAAEQEVARRHYARLPVVTDIAGEGLGAFNRAFHMTMLRPSRQPLMTQILERAHILSERYVRKYLEPLGRDDRANREHGELLTVWLDRDAGQLRRLTTAHIDKMMEDLRKQIFD